VLKPARIAAPQHLIKRVRKIRRFLLTELSRNNSWRRTAYQSWKRLRRRPPARPSGTPKSLAIQWCSSYFPETITHKTDVGGVKTQPI
jgi:hypothetical protein